MKVILVSLFALTLVPSFSFAADDYACDVSWKNGSIEGGRTVQLLYKSGIDDLGDYGKTVSIQGFDVSIDYCDGHYTVDLSKGSSKTEALNYPDTGSISANLSVGDSELAVSCPASR